MIVRMTMRTTTDKQRRAEAARVMHASLAVVLPFNDAPLETVQSHENANSELLCT